MYFFTRFYSVDGWLNSNAETIYSVGNKDDWVVPNNTKQMKVLKPPYHLKVGRPKANWRPSQGEKKKTPHHCSSCRGQGHNHSTCKYILPAPYTVN